MGSAPADNPSEVTSIGVQYKHAEGWHVFFSDDLPGLYVASEDPRKAYDDIAPAIEKLIKLDTGVTVTAEPQLSFEQWLAVLRRPQEARQRIQRAKEALESKPLVLGSQRYNIHARTNG